MRVTAPRNGHQHMFLGRECPQVRLRRKARMPAAGDAHIALDPQRLPPDALWQCRKGAHGEIELAGFEPTVELRRLELQHMQLDVRRVRHQPLDERWQQLEQPGVDDTEVEGPARGAWIKYNVFAAQ